MCVCVVEDPTFKNDLTLLCCYLNGCLYLVTGATCDDVLGGVCMFYFIVSMAVVYRVVYKRGQVY